MVRFVSNPMVALVARLDVEGGERSPLFAKPVDESSESTTSGSSSPPPLGCFDIWGLVSSPSSNNSSDSEPVPSMYSRVANQAQDLHVSIMEETSPFRLDCIAAPVVAPPHYPAPCVVAPPAVAPTLPPSPCSLPSSTNPLSIPPPPKHTPTIPTIAMEAVARPLPGPPPLAPFNFHTTKAMLPASCWSHSPPDACPPPGLCLAALLPPPSPPALELPNRLSVAAPIHDLAEAVCTSLASLRLASPPPLPHLSCYGNVRISSSLIESTGAAGKDAEFALQGLTDRPVKVFLPWTVATTMESCFDPTKPAKVAI